MKTPHALIVLDGFGIAPGGPYNAIDCAATPAFDRLFARYPHTAIQAHGTAVGLMPGLMGNSEVGHMNIGAGRVVAQDIDRINTSIENGSFFQNAVLKDAIEKALESGRSLHLLGLVSDGGVHSADNHNVALLEFCARAGLTGDRVVQHVFTDGRDTAPRSADTYISNLERAMAKTGVGVIGTVVGRYYAMDRDKRWDRVQLAYDALVRGVGEPADNALGAVADAWDAGQDDEFILPRIISNTRRISEGDSVIFFNFRADRARQLTEALALPGFDAMDVASDLNLNFCTLTRYKETYPVPHAFTPISLEMVFGELAESVGLKQLRVAETEKYAHVTFFFNGGREEPFKGEDRVLVPSPRVPTYDLQPEMSSPEITEAVLKGISDAQHDVYIMNFANPDMVGHTGKFDAAVSAVESVDLAVRQVTDAVLEKGGTVLLTADHGNIEQMFDPATGQPHTAHTINPVPLLLIGDRFRGKTLAEGGRLADVIPTLCEILEVGQPEAMTGLSLLS